jgi:uncharacterized protein YjiS (DUF1127 family)
VNDMTAIRIETPAEVGAGHILRATATALAGWWRRRQAIRQLSATADFLLRDMGLTRGGIESAVRHGRRQPRR